MNIPIDLKIKRHATANIPQVPQGDSRYTSPIVILRRNQSVAERQGRRSQIVRFNDQEAFVRSAHRPNDE